MDSRTRPSQPRSWSRTLGGQEAEVGGDGQAQTFGEEAEADGIGGVVRDGEGHDVDISDGERAAGGEGFESLGLDAVARGVLVLALPGAVGGRGHVDGQAELFGHDVHAGDVVGVLVGDEDGGERLRAQCPERRGGGRFRGRRGRNRPAGGCGSWPARCSCPGCPRRGL